LPAFRLFAGQLSTNPLLLSPQALLDDALLGVLSVLLEPPLSLDGRTQLGWTTWLGRRKAAGDADDLCVDAERFVDPA